DIRAVMRSYTLRALRRDPGEIDIDFVLHTPAGPASSWAARAAAGDRVLVLGPAIADNRAIRFRPPADTGPVVLWGDETAVPAVAAVLETLPAGTPAQVWLEVRDPGDVQDLPTAADAEITWLIRNGACPEGTPLALDPLRAAHLPAADRPYVWLAGESGSVKALRRHFVAERGLDRRRVTFVGYWRHGMSEEQLRATA
ncbi:siderophore-interacting protein, partial [Streptomyces nigra]